MPIIFFFKKTLNILKKTKRWVYRQNSIRTFVDNLIDNFRPFINSSNLYVNTIFEVLGIFFKYCINGKCIFFFFKSKA